MQIITQYYYANSICVVGYCRVDDVKFSYTYVDNKKLTSMYRYPTRAGVYESTVPSICHGGDIRWDYPASSLQVHFRRPSKYSEHRICLKDVIVGYIVVLYDDTMGQNVRLGRLNTGKSD